MVEKPLTVRIHDIEEFDEKMLKKALKVIEGKEEFIEVKKLNEEAKDKRE